MGVFFVSEEDDPGSESALDAVPVQSEAVEEEAPAAPHPEPDPATVALPPADEPVAEGAAVPEEATPEAVTRVDEPPDEAVVEEQKANSNSVLDQVPPPPPPPPADTTTHVEKLPPSSPSSCSVAGLGESGEDGSCIAPWWPSSPYIPTEHFAALHAVVRPAAAPVLDVLHGGWTAVEGRVAATAAALDVHLAQVPPHSLVLLTFFLSALVFMFFDVLASWRKAVARRGGARAALFAALRSLPGVSSMVEAEQARILRKLRSKDDSGGAGHGTTSKAGNQAAPAPVRALPAKGMQADDVLDMALELAQADVSWTPGESRMSGSVYMHDAAHFALLNRVYARFAHSNPLHGDIFAASGRMEREVVAMTASLLGGGARHGGSPSVCGCLTSGGTESILTAVRTTRDFFADVKGVHEPEMIVAVSAHAAVFKASHYFGVKLVTVAVDSNLQMDVSATRRAVTANTVLIYASVPGFPHGVVDNVPALAKIARDAGCGLHVDACLGGFVLPFAAKAGWRSANGQLPAFDFRVPGVTSMSVDTHKYGLAQKGSSVLLYATPELRRYQYTAVTEWSGGLYISPSAAGSRPGGLIAQTWASLLHMGEEGFVAAAKRVLFAADQLAVGIARIPGLVVLGKQHTMVVAWKSTDSAVNIYNVNDVMSTPAGGGWHLNALQRPPALHFCVTPANADSVPQLLADLARAVAQVKAARKSGGGGTKGGKAPIYGLGGSLPDRGAVGDILKLAQDVMLDG